MATLQSNLVCDSSTYANYFSWASAISAALASFGWAQSADTGQVMWTGLSISAATQSGSSTIYTYSGLTGLALTIGRALTITGMTNSANNGVKVITSFTGTTSGTFTVLNASGVTETGSSGLVTAASAVPGSAAYFYEVWQPTDGLTSFYLKIETGNVSGTNCPTVRLTIGTATNSAGTLTGLVMGPLATNSVSYTVPSSTATYPCYFSGSTGRFSMMMWRAASASCPQLIAVERSVNASGVYTGSHVTIMTAGYPYNGNYSPYGQQSLVFGVGVAPAQSIVGGGVGYGGMAVKCFNPGTANSASFNGALPFDTTSPMIGYYDYPLTSIGTVPTAMVTEGQIFSTTLYGSTRTYICSVTGPLGGCVPNYNSRYQPICMRYD